MDNSKKRSIVKKQDSLQEPLTDYEMENNLISNDSEKLHPIL